jgi:MFS family permease
LRCRLSVLLFLEFAAPGAMLPLFSKHLQDLNFSALEIGCVSATQALGTLIGPVLFGQVADRWLPAERCLSIGGICAGALLLLLPFIHTPATMFAVTLLLWMFLAAGLSLCASVSFSHLANPEREFGVVRLCGTLGWVVPSVLMFVWFRNPEWLCRCVGVLRPDRAESELADVFRLGALASFLAAAYAYTLPITPPARGGNGLLAPLKALALLRSRKFSIYLVCAFLAYVLMPFTTQLTPLLLCHLGLSPSELALTLPLAQLTEIISLALLPMIVLRLGLTGTMALGLCAWAAALMQLTAGAPTSLVIASLTLNGLFVTCFLVAGQLFVNSRATGDIRASTQGLLGFTTGLGLLTGHLLIGVLRRTTEGFAPTFGVGAVGALVLLCVFVFGFHEGRSVPVEVEETLPTEEAIQQASTP